MTHDPRLATLERVLDGNPFELIDSPFAEGKMERWRANAMATGTMGYLAQVYEMVRNDAAALEEKTAALDAKKSAVLNTVNRLLKFMSRVDALTSRVEALEAQRKADEATQRKLDEEPLTLPPDIQEYQASTPPEPIGDESHQPGGELHPVAAKEEPSLDDDLTDNLGDLPAELRDLPDPAPEPKGSVLPPPTALFGS